MTLNLSDVSAGVYSEGSFDSSTYKNSNLTVSHESFFVGPSLGVGADGSIYHPNLVRYRLRSDGAFGYSQDRFTSDTTTVSRNELHYLGRFGLDMDFLPGKPYNANFFSNYDHSFRDNDFFDRVMVDSWRYGGKAAWDLGRWTLSGHYTHRDEESTSSYPLVQSTPGGSQIILDQKTTTHEDSAGMMARHERDRGGSSISYNFDQYTHEQATRVGEGTDQSISLGDTERFGAREQYRLNSNMNYSHRQTSEETDNDLNASVEFSAEHTPRLSSFYALNYEHFDTIGYNSDSYAGSATLSHQLFESLSSSASVRASDTESSGGFFSGYSRRFGGGISEAYTKRLSENARLRISNSVFVDHTDQQALTIVENERHTIGEPGSVFPDSFYLVAPRAIISTIVITDSRNVQQFINGFDYQIIQEGTRTRIQWLNPPGQPVPSSVLAFYRTDPTPEGSYDTLSEGLQVRLEFWNNQFGVYSRVNMSLNNAAADLHVLDLHTYTFGADYTWRWLRTGAEYEIYDSSESNYRSTRLFQSLFFQVDGESTLSLDFSQSWISYENLNRPVEENFRFITRYHRALTRQFDLALEGGTAWRRGLGADQVLATARPVIRYVIGKTTVDAGYDYEYNLYQAREERQKHTFTLRVRRAF